MRVVLLVPRRADGGHRDRLWAACKARWQKLHPKWDIIEGHHEDGPFNRSAAVNRAAREAGEWDVAVIIDSDVLLHPENVKAAVRTARKTGKVTWAHRRWVGLTNGATAQLLADPGQLLEPAFAPDPSSVEKTNPISWSCCVALTREAWDTIGGFDERFRGWGWEDMAFQCVAVGLVGHERIEGDVYHLWHPRSPGLGKLAPGIDGIVSARLGRRYMLALRRDHDMHDRVEAADEAEMGRDMENLRRADAKLSRQAKRLGLPDWDGWWPTLEELRDHTQLVRSIGLIVHSGGIPEAWEARSTYLRQALASLDEHIRHPWERRVIFSDWGQQPGLAEIAAEYGFDVAGPPVRVGYTKSMQSMWRYIHGTRADHLFVTEDDFLIDRDVDIEQMSTVLEEHPHIAQMALLRGPFYEAERDPATLLGHPLDAFAQKTNGDGTAWLEHSRFFTANPMLMRRSLTSLPWPSSRHSEAVFGRQLFRRRDVRAAFWGTGEPWISHIGEVRGGADY